MILTISSIFQHGSFQGLSKSETKDKLAVLICLYRISNSIHLRDVKLSGLVFVWVDVIRCASLLQHLYFGDVRLCYMLI